MSIRLANFLNINMRTAILAGICALFLFAPAIKPAYAQDGGCDTLRTQLEALDTAGQYPIEDLPKYCTANSFLFKLIRIIFLIAGGVAVLFVMIGGFQYMIGMSTGGDEAIGQAKKTITYALIGLVIIILAGTLVTIIVNLIIDTKSGNKGNSNTNKATGNGSNIFLSPSGTNGSTSNGKENSSGTKPTSRGVGGNSAPPSGGSLTGFTLTPILDKNKNPTATSITVSVSEDNLFNVYCYDGNDKPTVNSVVSIKYPSGLEGEVETSTTLTKSGSAYKASKTLPIANLQKSQVKITICEHLFP